MKGFGQRLRLRARELGLTDSEIARRLDLSQGRYSNYVNEVVEPDLTTLVRIVRVLGISADEALGLERPLRQNGAATLRERIALAAEAMEPTVLQAVAATFDAAAKAAQGKTPRLPSPRKGQRRHLGSENSDSG